MKKIIFASMLLMFNMSPAFAQTEVKLPETPRADEPERIPLLDVITKIPHTSMLGLEKSFTKESIPYWVGILGSTLILYNNDEVILRDWQREGRNAGIGNDDNTKAVITAGEIDLLRLPSDTGSMMYFLGDGWMHAGIAGGFFFNGMYNHSNRSYNTGLRLAHGMAVSTIFSQILKRSFGRESPYVKTEYLGKWRPFTSISEYQAHTASYDAMPSGHIMTATLTFTIIQDNYPEYSNVIVPVGVLWISALGFQMVNNGVHWAADYPLGIAMGYVFGKVSSQLGKPEVPGEKTERQSWMLMPTVTPYGDGVTWLYSF